jgi:phosphohistidine phosphatase
MKTLLILRHAKSGWKELGLTDRDRPLNNRGRRDAPLIGALLSRKHLKPDLIVSSTARRALTTAEMVADNCDYGSTVQADHRLYLAKPETVIDVVRSLAGDASTVLLVGHNPGLRELIALMTGAIETFPTAALAQVQLSITAWCEIRASTRSTLVNIWRPKNPPN